jgi:pyruvate/2-oxoglutarate dehydrogenase complex dihydrolipoamide dehydrogenase (E3) component
VDVVGGGPSGLEAARVAAARGHRVVLFEQSGQLGGQTLIARLAPGRQDFDGAIRWSGLQCKKLGVEIRMNCTATVQNIAAESPDVVVIATGARARMPKLPGMEQHQVLCGWDVLLGQAVGLGRVVLVIDEEYGHQAPTIAEFLLDSGREVDLITSQETIGNFLGATTRPPLLRRLFRKHVQIFNHLEAQSIAGGCLTARNIWSGELHEVGPYDSFVYAYGGQSRDELSAPLKAAGLTVKVIGDAFAPRSLQHAILEGHQLGREL